MYLSIPYYCAVQIQSPVSSQQVGHVKFKSSCPVEVSHLDHLVLTVKNVPDTINFYTSVLGMEVVTFKVCQRLFFFFAFRAHQLFFPFFSTQHTSREFSFA